jgi:FAD:protein FMN transferase
MSAFQPAAAPDIATLSGSTMGTRFTVAYAPPAGRAPPGLAEALQAAVEAVDRDMSTWKVDSALCRFNRAPVGDWIAVPADLAVVVGEGLAIAQITGGAFDPVLGRLVDLWGFGPDGFQGQPSAEALDQARAESGFEAVRVRDAPPALLKTAPRSLDLSGIAKGFGVDRLAETLEGEGIADYLVTLDGEVRVKGRKGVHGPWQVAVDAPVFGRSEPYDILWPPTGALATSGDYRQRRSAGGRTWSHTIDGRTGEPVDNALGSVTVAMDKCVQADAWASALLVLGPDEGPALAQAKGVAALFLVREDEGVRAVLTGGFERVIG